MSGLAGVVGDELDGVGKRAELCFGGLKEYWKTPGWGEDFAKMVAGGG